MEKKRKYNNRITEIDGIKFKSKLEVLCYNKLNEASIDFEYENKRFTLVPTSIYEHPSYERIKVKGKNTFKPQRTTIPKITYKPDFVGNGWIIETKGFETDNFKTRWKLFKKYLSDNNLKYTLFLAHNEKEIDFAIEIIKNNIINGQGKEEILNGKGNTGDSKKVARRKRGAIRLS